MWLLLGTNFRECPQGEVRRIPIPRTPVNKPVHTFCYPRLRASSDKNHSFGGCAGCLELLPFQGSGKEVKDCWDNRRAPKRHTMAAFSENTLIVCTSQSLIGELRRTPS